MEKNKMETARMRVSSVRINKNYHWQNAKGLIGSWQAKEHRPRAVRMGMALPGHLRTFDQ